MLILRRLRKQRKINDSGSGCFSAPSAAARAFRRPHRTPEDKNDSRRADENAE